MTRIFFLAALYYCGIFTSRTCCAAPSAGDIRDRAWFELASCDDIPEGVTDVETSLEVTGAISCQASLKVLNISPGAHIMVHAKHDLEFFGVQFLVHPGAQLSFVARGGMTLGRNQAMESVPVVIVAGELIVSAGKHVPGVTKYAETLLEPHEEQQKLLAKEGHGAVYSSGAEVTFTANEIVVAAPVDRSSEDTRPQGDPSEQADEIEELADRTEDEPAGNENAPHTPDANVTTDHLNQGDTLRDGILVSSDGAVELWAGVHGSVFFAKYLAAKKLSEDGKASRSMELSTLIPANHSKVQGVLKIRARLKKEAAGGKRANIGKRNVFGWTPWGRSFNAQIDMARERAGEVDMTVDDKGCLEVTVDGCCVLSKSGSHAWEWVNQLTCRKRCPAGYRLKVVENGLEVQLDSDKVWGVTLPETDDKKLSEGRSFFGVTAADIL